MNLPSCRRFSFPGVAAILFLAVTTVQAQWTKVTAEASPAGQDVGTYTSLAIVNGHPAISYYDILNQDLKYVRATDPAGTAWGTPITVYSPGRVGEYNSLCVVNGVPTIAYHNWDFARLNFVRALDANGATWASPIVLDSGSSGGLFCSLAIVGGNPAISYNATSGLKYIRATNASGTAWGAAITIDAGLNNGDDTSLAVVNGNPAISYLDYPNGNLKYVRANNATGALVGDWGAPIAIDTVGTVGFFSSLVVAGGNPAIAYMDFTNANLKYVRATNATGALLGDWGPPITLDSAGTLALTLSLAIVDGNPAISYYDASDTRLKYVQATNSTGALLADWAAPVIIDDDGGSFSSLEVVNGTAGISYYDYVNDDLKFAFMNPNAARHWVGYE